MVYGLPMRAATTFPLEQNYSYRLFNQDKVDHPYGTLDPLYGNWPYLTSHSAAMDASAVWMNSSETYVNIEPTTTEFYSGQGTQADFISVGGKFEFFMLATTTGPKENHTIHANLSGFPPLPPIHSLGFHYCKWEENNALMMVERSKLFTQYEFPLDVLWTDLYYTQDFEYFVFNRDTWPLSDVTLLNAELEKS